MRASVIIVALAVLAALSPAAGAIMYTITDLGTLGGNTSALDVSDTGYATGYSTTPSYAQHAYVWQAGVMTDLGTLGGTNSYGYGVNEAGQVAGSSQLASGYSRAFLWTAGVMTDLGTLGGNSSEGRAVNESGHVTGHANGRAFLWDGTMQDLGTLGGSQSIAEDLNDSDVVVGRSITGLGYWQAFAWASGVMTGLDSLGGTTSYAEGINAAGDIVGASYNGSGDTRATLWSGGLVYDLGTLGGYSVARDINDSGQVVGYSETLTGVYPFIWEGGAMWNLSSLLPAGSGWTLWEACAINNSGQIVGCGSYNGESRGFLMTPVANGVPAPGAMLLGVIGVAVADIMRRVRARA